MSDNYTEPNNNQAGGAGDDDKNQEIMKRLSDFLGENNFTGDSLQKQADDNVTPEGVRTQTSNATEPTVANFDGEIEASTETTTPTFNESQTISTPNNIDNFDNGDAVAPNAPTPEVPVADVDVDNQTINTNQGQVNQQVAGEATDIAINTISQKLTSINDIQEYLDTFESDGRTLTQDQLAKLRSSMLLKTDSVIDNVLNSAMSQFEMASTDNAKIRIIEETASSLRSFTVVLTPEQRTRIETFRDNIVAQIQAKNQPINVATTVDGDSVTEKIIDNANNSNSGNKKKRKLAPWFKWVLTILVAVGIGATGYFVFTAFNNNNQEIVKSSDSSSKKTTKKSSSNEFSAPKEDKEQSTVSATSTPNGYTVGSLINVEYQGQLIQVQILDITTTGIVAHSNYLNQDIELSFAQYPYI